MENAVELIKTSREYFNDFVGAIIPGSALAAGLTVQWAGIIRQDAFSRYWGEWDWLPGVAAIFASGHTLLSLHAFLINRFSTDRARKRVNSKASTVAYQKYLGDRMPKFSALALADFNAVRNYAMSVSDRAGETGRRFTFLSLFCYGTATAFAVLACSALVAPTLGYGKWGAFRAIIAVLLGLSAGLLDRRGLNFEVQALGTPLAIACAELAERDKLAIAAP